MKQIERMMFSGKIEAPFSLLLVLTAILAVSGGAWGYPVTIVVQSDPPGLTPYPSVAMDGGVTDIPASGSASLWVNPTAGWEWTANLYNLGGNGVNYADGGDPLCTPHVTVTNATLYKGNATWPAANHFNWYQILNPTGNITVTVTFKAVEYNITRVTASDPPGLTVPSFDMDGGVTTIYHNQYRSFWVKSDATQDVLPFTAFQATTDQYNLGAWDWPPNCPDYADGGDPLCTPHVTVSNAKLYKGNATWPVANHFDWYNVYDATSDVTITATYKPREIPVSYGAYITGPAVVYHEYTGHSIVVTPEERTGYTLTGVSTTSGTASDNGNGTWTVSGVTDLSSITVTASYTINTYTVIFDLNGGIYQGGGALVQVVEHGSDATPPNNPKRCDYTFDSWSGAYTNVTSNRTITATWVSSPCDDGIPCTIDECDPLIGDCTNTPSNALCDDNNVCNGAETCDPLLGCQAGTPLDCDDGVACTVDSCDPIFGCAHAADDGACDDNNVCNGVETCDPLLGCQSGSPLDCNDGVACTVDSCDPVLGCAHAADDSACDDNNVCNGIETCDPVLGCQSGTPLDCDDGVACTVDSCDPISGCAHAADDGACDDSNVCNGVETCDPLLGCQPGTPLDCDDGVACTVDSCDPVTGCAHAADDSACDDSNVCNGIETCDPLLGCQPGTPLDCDDGVACTVDSCDPVSGCAHAADDGACDDNNVCNGVETCDPLLGCQSGTPLDCDDGVACTVDSCDPVTGCAHAADDSTCDDNDVCNGTETCDPVLGCQSGTPLDCDDSDLCTIDTCDAVTGCANTPRDCDDGDPCTDDYCNPSTGECVHDTICEGEGETPVEGEGEPPVEGEGEPAGLTVTADQTTFTEPVGASVLFEVQVSGAQGTLSYQWYRYTPDKALATIADATDTTYTITSVAYADAGQYQCEVYDDVLDETAWSPFFTLEVYSGVPAAGLLGLALASALTALSGASIMRKKK